MTSSTLTRETSELRIQEHTLTTEERSALVAACTFLVGGNGVVRQDQLLTRIGEDDTPELGHLRAEIAAFGDGHGDAPLLVLRDVPTVPDPRCAIALLASFLGPLLRYDNEGDYIIELKKGAQRDGARPSSANSRAFAPHTDLSYLPHPAPFLVMHSLVNREADGGFSVFCDVEQAVARLDPSTVAELEKPQFLFPPPAYYAGQVIPKCPVLERARSGGWRIRFRRDDLHADTRVGMEAVIALVKAVRESTNEVMLHPGTLALIDNRALLHGRTAFVSSNGSSGERHLNRVYVGTTS